MLRNVLIFVLLAACLILVQSSPLDDFSWLRAKRQVWRYGGFGMADGAGSTWENAHNGGVSVFGWGRK